MRISLTGKGNSGGFTLLELLMVMAILAMVSALVIPRINNDRKIFKSQVREAIAVLRYAKRMAIIRGQPIDAVFQSAPQASAIQRRSEKRIQASPLHWASKGALLEWNKTEGDRDRDGYLITFFPEGGSSGADLVLRQNEYFVRIVVDPITGQISEKIGDE